jgi:transaldolase
MVGRFLLLSSAVFFGATMCSAWQRQIQSRHRDSFKSSNEQDYEAKVARAFAVVDKLTGANFGRPFQSSNLKPSSLHHRGKARLFLDTADIVAFDKHLSHGYFYGVTTNPVILQRAKIPCTIPALTTLAVHAIERECEEIMFQAWGEDRDSLIRTGSLLAAIDSKRVVVKVPLTLQGMKAARVLGRDGVRICLTACYNVEQALVAASLGAEYVAPYLGRICDSGRNGVEICASMQQVVAGLGSTTRILVASLRDATQLTSLASRGCDTFTFSPHIADELLYEPLTTHAAADFEAAAIAMGGLEE